MIMRGPASRRLSWFGLASAIALGLLALPAWTLGDAPKPRETPPAAEPGATPSAAPAVPENRTPVALPGVKPAGVRSEAVTELRPVTTYRGDEKTGPAPDAADRDQKLKELEDKVQRLLKEMQQLRGQAPANRMPPPGAAPQESVLQWLTSSGSIPAAQTPAYPGTNVVRAPLTVRVESDAEVITLTRVSYYLKPATAEALSAFLKDNVKTAILETKAAA